MYWNKEGNCMANGKEVGTKEKKQLKLDGEAFPILKQDKRGVPTGIVEVPVTVKALDLGLEFDTRIVAGSMGMTVTHDPEKDMQTTVQPHSG
jgi:hypothetical protein